MPLVPGGGGSASATGFHGPSPRRIQVSSSRLSERCVATGRPSSRQAPYSSGETVYGACGEMPSRTRSENEPATRSRFASKRVSSCSSVVPKTSRYTIARRPSASQALADAPTKLQSPTVVIPEARHSAAPSRAIASISSRPILAFRSTWIRIQGANGWPSPKPAYTAYSRCECALTKPGRIDGVRVLDAAPEVVLRADRRDAAVLDRDRAVADRRTGDRQQPVA